MAANRITAVRSWFRPALAIPYVLSARLTSLPPSSVFRHMTPSEWYWLSVHGERTFPSLHGYLPSLPPEEIQVRFTGTHSEDTLREAFAFYQIVSRETRGGHPRSAVDFGCGWGRITRFFIKDFGKDGLLGVDPIGGMIDLCRSSNPWATFEQIDLFPPLDLPSASVDVIFAFSVFSHLTEEVHLQWLAEFARVLRPGGSLIVTTRERDFILDCAAIREQENDLTSVSKFRRIGTVGARSAFLDTQGALERYDAGEYCCDPIGAGEDLPSATYGETAIPFAYVQRRWPPNFRVVEFLDAVPGVKQNIIVARRT